MVTERDYAKLCDAQRLTDELIEAGELQSPSPGFTIFGVSVDPSVPLTQVWVIDTLSGGDATIIDAIVAAHTPTAYPLQDARDVFLINNGSTEFIPGNIVYADTNNTVKLASASGSDTARVYGLSANLADKVNAGVLTAIRPYDALTLTTAQWDAVFGTSGGLIINTPYYLSTVPGKGTDTAPSGSGLYVAEIGYALSSTTLMIRIRQSMLL